MKTKIVTILAIAVFTFGKAQIPSNTLFIIIDKNSEFVQFDISDRVKIKYTIWNEEMNWYSYLHHLYKPNSNYNHFKYVLPKEMFEDFKEIGNVMTSEKFEATLKYLKLREASNLIQSRYPSYDYTFFDGKDYKTYLRDRIFLVFKSDLEKDYIECFEVRILFDLISQH